MNTMVSYAQSVGASLWIQNLVHGLAGTTIKAKHAVYCEASAFQKIEVFDTYSCGMVLCLGGSIVLTEHDCAIYHEMMCHPALLTHKKPRTVCIIGGGDGGCLTEVLKYKGVQSVTVVDIDRMVTKTVERFFPQLAKGFKDKRVKVVFDDGYEFMKSTREKFDVILVDSYDPAGPVQSLETADFHDLVAQRLTPDGVIVFQTDSPRVRPDFLRQTITLLSPLFSQTRPYVCAMPSFPEGICSFLICSRAKGSLDTFDARRYKEIAESCTYYNRDIHTGAFLLPQYLKKRVAEAGR